LLCILENNNKCAPEKYLQRFNFAVADRIPEKNLISNLIICPISSKKIR
jgi:hypothetical protein